MIESLPNPDALEGTTTEEKAVSLVKNSFSILKWIADETNDGQVITSMSRRGKLLCELDMPILQKKKGLK